MKPGRKKGTKKTGGRSSGTPNRTTKEGKLLLENILMNQLDNANEAFESLRGDPAKFIDAYAKLLGYVLPKKTDVTSDGKEIKSQLPLITIKTKNA